MPAGRRQSLAVLQGEMAGGDVAGPERAQLRLLLGTQILCERAPGAEPAARWWGHRTGQFALDPRALPGSRFRRIRDRNGCDEPGRVGMRGALVEVLRRAR